MMTDLVIKTCIHLRIGGHLILLFKCIKLGDVEGLYLNSMRLEVMTSSYINSNFIGKVENFTFIINETQNHHNGIGRMI